MYEMKEELRVKSSSMLVFIENGLINSSLISSTSSGDSSLRTESISEQLNSLAEALSEPLLIFSK